MHIPDERDFGPDWHRRWREPEPMLMPSPIALQAKREWMAAHDLGQPSDLSTVRQGKEFSRCVALAYAAMPNTPRDPAVVRAYAAFVRETETQYAHLVRSGIQVVVSTADPYATTAELVEDVNRGRLLVFATSEGEHPLMSAEENDLFRAVHDCFGHCATGRTFDRHGEEAAYRSHAEMYSPLARRALASETRGQNAALIWTGEFQAQKAGLLPPEFV
jgi:hypothetical protein